MKRRLATNPLHYTELELAILADVRARTKAGLPVPRGYIVRRVDGSLIVESGEREANRG